MEIVITGSSMSLEELQRAKAVPARELPQLTDEQREIARKFNMPEEEWAQALLAARFGENRVRAGATRLARVLEDRLPKQLPDIEMRKLVYEVGLEDHRFLVRFKKKDYVVRIPRTSVDDWLASGKQEEFDQLCRAIARQVDQG